MATTFTILAVFLPVGFMTGIVGQFFKSFALTIAFAVSISLLVAFTLDPMLSSRFVRFIPLEERTRTRTGRFLERVGGFYDRIDRQYHGLLDWAIAHPWKIVATAAVVFFASMSTLSVIGTEFVPQEDRGEFVVNIEVPPGTAFEQTVAHVAEVEKVVKEMPEVRQIFSTVGFEGSPLKASLRVKAGKKHERERGLARAQGRHPRAPQADAAAEDDGGRSRVHAGRADAGAAQRVPARRRHGRTAAPQRRGRAEGQGGARRGRRRQHARNRPAGNGRRASIASWPPTSASTSARWRCSCAAWSKASCRRACARTTRSTTSASGSRRSSATTSRRSRGRRSTRRPAPWCAPATSSGWIPKSGPAAIEREARRRQAKINIELSDRSLGEVTADVGKVMAGITMPPNFEWGFAGDVEMMQESAAAMGLALLLAMAFIYIVLASQFESFLEPFLIMISLPLALVGALLAILLTGKNLGMPAMIGVVMLMGLVTKNAILLVDLTNQYVREGLSVKDAILKAGPVRLRPILMTTIAMILGMMPSAMSPRMSKSDGAASRCRRRSSGDSRGRRDDAGVGGGDGTRDAPGGGVHLHRARVAVRVVPPAVHDHALAAAGAGRRDPRCCC